MVLIKRRINVEKAPDDIQAFAYLHAELGADVLQPQDVLAQQRHCSLHVQNCNTRMCRPEQRATCSLICIPSWALTGQCLCN
jgi:hypothetical protein